MKKQHTSMTIDEMELQIGYDYEEHTDMLSDDPPYTESWIEFEITSVEIILFGRGYDILPQMSRKEVDRLARHVSQSHPSMIASL
jgi:hypothetical protein